MLIHPLSSIAAIATRAVLQAMLKYAQSTHTQLRNVAALFVQTLHA